MTVIVNVAKEYNLTPYHISNLETLRDFLRSDDIPPPIFDISGYANTKDRTKTLALLGIVEKEEFEADDIISGSHINVPEKMTVEIYSSCGTTACAVGHGPLAGIPVLPGETWHDYEYRVFGVSKVIGWQAWSFLFSGQWADSPLNNTAKGSAARIDYFLKHGVPEDYYYRDGTVLPRPWFDGLDTSTFIVGGKVQESA